MSFLFGLFAVLESGKAQKRGEKLKTPKDSMFGGRVG